MMHACNPTSHALGRSPRGVYRSGAAPFSCWPNAVGVKVAAEPTALRRSSEQRLGVLPGIWAYGTNRHVNRHSLGPALLPAKRCGRIAAKWRVQKQRILDPRQENVLLPKS